MNLDELIAKHSLLQNVKCGVFVPNGWIQLVDDLFNSIELKLQQIENSNIVVIEQVKEKFGELRVYLDILDREIAEMELNK